MILCKYTTYYPKKEEATIPQPFGYRYTIYITLLDSTSNQMQFIDFPAGTPSTKLTSDVINIPLRIARPAHHKGHQPYFPHRNNWKNPSQNIPHASADSFSCRFFADDAWYMHRKYVMLLCIYVPAQPIVGKNQMGRLCAHIKAAPQRREE